MASRCEDGTVTGDFLDKLPNFHIDTFSELEEHSGRFAEVSESDEGEENANSKKKTFYDLKLVKMFQVEERHEIKDSDLKNNKKRVESEKKAIQAKWTRKQTKSHNGCYGRRNWDSFWQKVAWIKFTASSVK